jgi:hypothetical protein
MGLDFKTDPTSDRADSLAGENRALRAEVARLTAERAAIGSDHHDAISAIRLENYTLRAEVDALRERAERAEATLRPFATFLAWIEAAVEVGDLAPITDASCVTSIHPGGGSHYLWVGDFRRAQEALLGVDAAPAGEGGAQ